MNSLSENESPTTSQIQEIIKQDGVIESGLPAQTQDLRTIVDISQDGNEYGLLLCSEQNGNKKYIFGQGSRSIRPYKGITYYHKNKYVLFHSHPGAKTLYTKGDYGSDNQALDLIPSFRHDTYWQGFEGDIDATEAKRSEGGFANIASHSGVTFCVARESVNTGEEAASYYLAHTLGDIKEVHAKGEIIIGNNPGKTFTNKKELMKENPQILDDKGMALFQISNQLSGIRYTFLSLSWEEIENKVTDLEDLVFGNGLTKLADDLGIQEYVLKENLSAVLKSKEGGNYSRKYSRLKIKENPNKVE